MNNLAVAQSFMLCALNEKGKFPLNSNNPQACLMAGGLIDLLLRNCVAVTDKKAHIIAPLNSELWYLQSIYDFINEKGTVKLEKLAENYCFTFSDKKINELIKSIGDSLGSQSCVTLEQGGLFGKKDLYIPNKDIADSVVQYMRKEFLKNGILSDEIVALASLFEKGGMLKRYFSSYEKNTLKARLKEIKNESSNQIIREILGYLETMLMVVIIAAT